MSIVLVGSTSGSITLQEPAVAGSTVLSLPATTGTVLTSASPSSDLPSSINGPAFRAWASANTSLGAGASTKIPFNNEEFDTNNCFDSVTNFRFTPNVAGYYQINAYIRTNNGGAGEFSALIFKNNSNILNGTNAATVSTNQNASLNTTLVYMNGTTDYLEVYAYTTTACNLAGGSGTTSFSASLVRGA